MNENESKCRCGKSVGPHFCGYVQARVNFQALPVENLSNYCRCGAPLGTRHFCGSQQMIVEGDVNLRQQVRIVCK